MPKTAVLLIQLGTPDAPTSAALRPYLRQFLSDHRVIDTPRWKWWWILNLFILPFRPAASAAKYARIWDKVTGSPLLHHTRQQAEALRAALPGVRVEFGMQIGNPPLGDVLHSLIQDGYDRIIAWPQYPQYSATTTASATDCLFKALMAERRVPSVRIVPPCYEHPAYIQALAQTVREQVKALSWEPDHYVLSFHGIPKRYSLLGDPYATHCTRTARKLVQALGWRRDQWTMSYQSLFGREVWLKPYTEPTLERLARKGARKVFVVTPGFTADCLETLDEIGHEAAEAFEKAGGEKLFACPCLNSHPAWIEAMKRIVLEEGAGWL
jgi:ferrochelatase